MDMSVRNQLMKDYVTKFYNFHRILEIAGFCRFVIRKGNIVERNQGTMLYNICVLIFANASAAYLLLCSNPKGMGISLVEYISILYFTVFANLLMSDITFSDKYAGLNIILSSIEIDALLGAEETDFMRDTSIKLYKIITSVIGITQVTIVVYIFYLFLNVSVLTHMVGTIYFFWLFFAYDEFCFFIYLYSFLTTRVRFLNVALIKITKIKPDYIKKAVLFHKLFWKDEYDERVTLHTKSDTNVLCVALRMIFALLRRIEDCYSFALILGAATVAVGSMVAVQTYIMYIQTAETLTLRATAIVSWSVASWFHLLIVSIQADMFITQIDQMKLICAYIQLKPNTSVEIFKLTKNILNTLEVRDARNSLYGMFSINTGFVLKIAASTFVYITVQLQIAFPNLKEVHKADNITSALTSPTFEPSQNFMKIKEIFFV